MVPVSALISSAGTHSYRQRCHSRSQKPGLATAEPVVQVAAERPHLTLMRIRHRHIRHRHRPRRQQHRKHQQHKTTQDQYQLNPCSCAHAASGDPYLSRMYPRPHSICQRALPALAACASASVSPYCAPYSLVPSGAADPASP